MDLPFLDELLPATAAASPGWRSGAPWLLSGWREGDAWLGGGTWLFSEPQPRIRRLFDLHALGWEPLAVSEQGLQIAATCRLSQLAALVPPPSWRAGHVIRRCCESLLGSFKVWNEATVGGNLCLALPAGPMTSLAASLDGVCEIWRADGAVEQVPAVEFVTGAGTSVLGPGSLLRSITLPVRALESRAAFRQMSRTDHGRSAALVIGLRTDDGATTVTVTAAVPRPLQLRFPDPPSVQDLCDAIDAAAPPWYADHHGSPPWREHLTRLLGAQVLAELDAEDAEDAA